MFLSVTLNYYYQEGRLLSSGRLVCELLIPCFTDYLIVYVFVVRGPSPFLWVSDGE